METTNLSPLDLKLYELLGDPTINSLHQEHNCGQWRNGIPTIYDLHKYIFTFFRGSVGVEIKHTQGKLRIYSLWVAIPYDSCKTLLEQSDKTKQAIIDLIENRK